MNKSALIIQNSLPIILLFTGILLVVAGEHITKDTERLKTIDNLASSLIFGSGIMYRGENREREIPINNEVRDVNADI